MPCVSYALFLVLDLCVFLGAILDPFLDPYFGPFLDPYFGPLFGTSITPSIAPIHTSSIGKQTLDSLNVVLNTQIWAFGPVSNLRF